MILFFSTNQHESPRISRNDELPAMDTPRCIPPEKLSRNPRNLRSVGGSGRAATLRGRGVRGSGPVTPSQMLMVNGLCMGEPVTNAFEGGRWLDGLRPLSPSLPIIRILNRGSVGRISFHRKRRGTQKSGFLSQSWSLNPTLGETVVAQGFMLGLSLGDPLPGNAATQAL